LLGAFFILRRERVG